MKQPFKRNWKILYTDYQGPVKRAVELTAREMGAITVRDAGVYCVHVLPVEKWANNANENAVIIGTFDSDPIFAQYIAEMPTNGFAVKVVDNPVSPSHQLVLVCGDTPAGVYYAAAHFVDDCFAAVAPNRNGLCFRDEIFLNRLPQYEYITAPKAKTRSLFTWGHPINDYRKCIETLARLKFNQIIVWNDYLPINAEEFVDYAHSFGLSVVWGYAWGWFPDCTKADLKKLDQLKADVIDTYNRVYKGKGDGIYFQSFTELGVDTLQGKLIAEVVTDFVNDTVSELLENEPGLLIQFGLHADSVKTHAEHLANIDPRVQIIWENCGIFPYSHDFRSTPTLQKDTLDFTKLVIEQRPKIPVGMVFKGMLKQDWPNFEHQAGPFILGQSSEAVIKRDIEMFTPIWRYLQNEWIKNGDFAHTLANTCLENATADLNFCIASHIADTPWYPLALCAELFWDPTPDYADIANRVSRRSFVNFA